jgi:hypothetical protein
MNARAMVATIPTATKMPTGKGHLGGGCGTLRFTSNLLF